MMIIEKTRMIFPRFKTFKSQSVTGGANNYRCFAMLGICITFVDDAPAFRQAVRRYAENDWSEHKQVRLAAKRARSKARAQERKFAAEDIDMWTAMFYKERDARFKAEEKISEHYKTIQAMKISFKELQK